LLSLIHHSFDPRLQHPDHHQTDKAIVERLGAYHATWGVGIHFLIPFVDHGSAQ
jgi:hypothetical protein